MPFFFIFWRGLGILVIGFILLSCWIASYFVNDDSMFDSLFQGYYMFGTGILSLLLWSILRNMSEPDPEPGEIREEPQREGKPFFTGHSFMFIPVVLWGFGGLGVGVWMMIKHWGEPNEDSESYETEIYDDYNYEEPTLEGEMVINFWNPQDDSVEMITTYAKSGDERMDRKIGPGSILFGTYDADKYVFEYQSVSHDITVQGNSELDSNSYEQAWYVMDDAKDLLLVDVSDVCRSDINESEIEEIYWPDKIKKRYTGGGLIEVKLDSRGMDTKYTVIDPGWDIPLEKAKNEKVYALIPIFYKNEAADGWLDKIIVDLCY